MTAVIVDADLSLAAHRDGLVDVLNNYAQLPDIAGGQLPEHVRRQLPDRLAEQPNRQVLLAMRADRVVGVAVCFSAFSTFAAKPLLNIHDLAVHSDARGQGVGTLLLDAVALRAKELGCCRVTLEVVAQNGGAKRLYERVGFEPSQEFWKKELASDPEPHQ